MKLLIIGQTPPPFGGQSINIERMLHIFNKHSLPYKFIRMNFSQDMHENGKTSFKKIFKLFALVWKLLFTLLFFKPDYVYFPPSGPEKVPVIRDMVVLFLIRLFRFKVIFHFHAGGITQIYPKLSSSLQSIFKFCFFYPDLTICLNESGKVDPNFLLAKQNIVIPSGVDDLKEYKQDPDLTKFIILFVGVCRESKGILDFIEIIRLARKENPKITGKVVGKAFSIKESEAIKRGVLEGIIEYEGVKTGYEKNIIFGQANLFLFPTFFEHENFPTVILEAFSCSIPVVATRWRGVVDQIIPGYNGYLHDVHDVVKASEYICLLSKDTLLYKSLAKNARLCFEENYTLNAFENNITNFFNSIK